MAFPKWATGISSMVSCAFCVPSLAEVTDRIYTRLTAAEYVEFGRIRRKTAGGYFGWPKHAPVGMPHNRHPMKRPIR